MFGYIQNRIPEISDDITSIDEALKTKPLAFAIFTILSNKLSIFSISSIFQNFARVISYYI